MITSLIQRTGRGFATAALLGLVVSAGCADMLTNTRVDRDRGIKLYNEGQYADAAGSFRDTLKHNPSDMQTHYYLAMSLDHMGTYEQAIQQYRTTLKIMDTSLEGKTSRAMRLQILDKLAGAVVKSQDHDQRAVAMLHGAQSAEDQFLLAKIERGLGDADASIEAYKRATLLEPQDADIHKEFGVYLAQLGQTEKARVELKRAYALNPNDEQTAAGLRQVGVIPGPSLKDESDMAHPLVPVGPIPELQIPGLTPDLPPSTDGQRATASPRE